MEENSESTADGKFNSEDVESSAMFMPNNFIFVVFM